MENLESNEGLYDLGAVESIVISYTGEILINMLSNQKTSTEEKVSDLNSLYNYIEEMIDLIKLDQSAGLTKNILPYFYEIQEAIDDMKNILLRKLKLYHSVNFHNS